MLLAEVDTNLVDNVWLIDPFERDWRHYRLQFYGVTSDVGLHAVITVRCSEDGGTTLDTGANYFHTGYNQWPSEGFQPSEWLGHQSQGWAIAGDNGDPANMGINGSMDIRCPGLVGGANVWPSYISQTVRGEIGTQSPVLCHLAGFWKGGIKPNAFELRADLNGPAAQLRGRIELWGVS